MLHNLIVDLGRGATYKEIKGDLEALENLELFVMSHIDADHVAGAIPMVRQTTPPFTPKRVWYNSRPQLAAAQTRSPIVEPLSARQGEKLARGIVKFAWPWNAEFASEIVSTDSPEAGQPIDIADGLTIRLLSPGDDQFVELLSKWDSALAGANIRTFDPDVDPDPLSPVFEPLGIPNVKDLAAAHYSRDRTEANGSSIAFIAEFEGKRVLLAADAHSEVLQSALQPLGVFRKLQELGLLWKIDLLTCVSGGSIGGGFLALNWGKDDALDKLEQYLGSASIAVSSVIGGILDPFSSRLDKLAKSYERDLFGKKNLGVLKDGPRIYFNSTNMSTGNMFFFVAGGGIDTEMGERELGVEPAGGFRISRAVAASSAFPPVFPPLKLTDKDYPARKGDYVTLTDGGVYDNLGVNPLFRMQRNKIDYAIVSDGGKPFAIDETPTQAGTIVLKEAIGILMEQVRGLQFKRLEVSHAAGQGPMSIWFSIDSREGEVNPGDAVFASAIKTNLKKLDSVELDALGRHAAGLLTSRINLYVPELIA